MPKGPPPLRFVSETAKKVVFHFIFLSSTLFTFPIAGKRQKKKRIALEIPRYRTYH